jgi:hypothetical protein
MNEPLGYSRDGDVVTLRMTLDDYQNLLVAIGYGHGAMMARGEADALTLGLSLADRINAGNPEYEAYNVEIHIDV